jgi:hypothetical protein
MNFTSGVTVNGYAARETRGENGLRAQCLGSIIGVRTKPGKA